MIEKKIHYIWMGKSEKPKLVLDCIDSWKRNLSEYEIIEWNEENFDINSNEFVKAAYKNKKWAFVSDFVRLHVLYVHGGIYLDTDVEVLKSFDKFLNHSAFIGFESNKYLLTSTIGAEKNHMWIKNLLSFYEEKSFFDKNGNFDLEPNVVNITKQAVENYHLKLNNEYQILPNDLHIYPKNFFCPSDYGDKNKKIQKKITKNTYCIHHYNGSWLTPLGKTKVLIRNMIGTSNIEKYKKIIKMRY